MADASLNPGMRLAVCAFFADEIKAALAAEGRSDVEIVPIRGACDGRPRIDDTQEASTSSPRAASLNFTALPLPVLCLTGACSGLPSCPATPISCFELALGAGTVTKLQARGARLLTPSMVRAWPETTPQRDMTPEQLREYYSEAVRAWVVVDLGVAPLTEAEGTAFASATGVPLETLPTELDLLRAALSNTLLRWELQETNTRCRRQIAENQHRLADFTMAYDFIGRLMPYQGEQRIIGDILELFTVLCAPRAVHFLLAGDNGELQCSSHPAGSGNLAMLVKLWQRSEPCGVLDTTQGFYFHIVYGEQKMGLIAVEEILNAERQGDYLDLALLLMPVLRVAICNARTYDRLCDTERSLRSSQAGLEQRVEERTAELKMEITERKKMEEELKRSNAELDQFAYAVSHDMRQPLRMVTSYLSLIEKALAEYLDKDTKLYLKFAVDGAARMDQMILAMLDYSRIGRKTDIIAPISSRDVLNDALAFLNPDITATGATVEVTGNWPELAASRDELTRLLQNLIGNALKYHEPDQPPRVEIIAATTPTLFRVTIRDHGIGIDPSQTQRLFKVFSRLQARTRFDGSGVGLALCRKIAEHHGGRIGVESAGEGCGSTFWFELPLTPANIDALQTG